MNLSLETLKLYARLYLRLFGLRCEQGGEVPLPSGPKIIAPNHPNATDVFFLPFVLSETPHFLMRSPSFRLPIIGPILRGAGQIEVLPQNGKAAFDRACALLEQSQTIVIFPQGKYSRDHAGDKARSGAVRLSLASGAPIIPLGIHVPAANLADMRTRWNGRFGPGLWQVSGTCFLRFGAAWHPDSENQSNVRALTDKLMNRIESLVEDARKESECVSPISLNPILQA